MDDWWLFFAVGFVAQLVDGALGMAYGVLTNTALLAIGLPPAQASAGRHAGVALGYGILSRAANCRVCRQSGGGTPG